MSDSTALDSFLDKWRARWPEWTVAEIFLAAERREPAVAWFALLQEFEDAMNIAGDPLPADAKLAWWGEELRGWSQRRSRHPLGRRLEPRTAPWNDLAAALPLLIQAREPAPDNDAAFAGLRGYGEAVAAVESVLFGGAGSVDAVIAGTLAARLTELGSQAVPMAIAGDADAQRATAWANTLLDSWTPRSGARERRLLEGFARGRLRRFAQAAQPAPLPSRMSLLLSAWRAARGT